MQCYIKYVTFISKWANAVRNVLTFILYSIDKIFVKINDFTFDELG